MEETKITTGTCQFCGQRIALAGAHATQEEADTAAGKAMPCDAQAMAYHAGPGGPENIMLPNGQLVRGRWAVPGEAGDGIGYRPHWASCRDKDR